MTSVASAQTKKKGQTGSRDLVLFVTKGKPGVKGRACLKRWREDKSARLKCIF